MDEQLLEAVEEHVETVWHDMRVKDLPVSVQHSYLRLRTLFREWGERAEFQNAEAPDG